MNSQGIFIISTIFLFAACTFTQKMKDGEMAFEYKHYQQAITMLTDEYNRTGIEEVKSRKAYLIAESHVINDNQEEALPWYRKAYEHDFGEIALVKYGRTLKRLERYDAALKIFQTLANDNPSNPEYRLEQSACERAIRWKSNQENYIVEKVSINSKSSEYAPTRYADGKIVFTSDRPDAMGEELYAWTGHKYGDFFVTDNAFNEVTPFSSNINTDEYEGTITFNTDYSRAIFTRCGFEADGDGYCKLYETQKRRFGWTEPQILQFIVDGYNYRNPTLANTDSILIFAAELEGGIGGFDLYYSRLTANGWNNPIALSQSINSPDHEKFPYLYKDTLYFASDRQGGLGGLDIYRSWQMDNGDWVSPQFLPAPINSGADDFGFMVDDYMSLEDNELEKGYFTSSRDQKNRDDIYGFVKLKEVEEEIVVEEEKEVVYELFLALKIVEKVYAVDNDPNSEVINKAPIPNALLVFNGERYEADNQGQIIIQVDYDQSYNMVGGKPGYLRNEKKLNTTSIAKDENNPIKTINEELTLDKIFVGKEIVLENIYYDLDEYFIRDDAKPVLDSLASVMKLNPSINIQLGSHTDCRGGVEYNLDLSYNRAKAAIDYLIQQGISRRRLQARGFGKSALIERCPCETCTEEQHQRNRRTTFAII